MRAKTLVLGALAALGLGGVALAAGQKRETSSAPVGEGSQFQLTYATSRPITDTDLTFIMKALTSAGGTPGMVVQGLAISGPQEFKANVSYSTPTDPKVGSVGVLGSNANDAITIQLVAANKVS